MVTDAVEYAEGDWFAVPLRNGGYGLGLIARVGPGGVLLGYFFGPRRSDLPGLADVIRLGALDAVLVRKFSHLGIANGTWPIVGHLDGWNRDLWPMPVFIRYEELTGRSFNVTYDNNDPSLLVGESQIAPGAEEQGPKDGLMGAGFAEKVLTNLLR